MKPILTIDICECGSEYHYIWDNKIDWKLYDIYECEKCYKRKQVRNRG